MRIASTAVSALVVLSFVDPASSLAQELEVFSRDVLFVDRSAHVGETDKIVLVVPDGLVTVIGIDTPELHVQGRVDAAGDLTMVRKGSSIEVRVAPRLAS